jgi:hypothetical protein
MLAYPSYPALPTKLLDFHRHPCYQLQAQAILFEALTMAKARIGGVTNSMEDHLPERDSPDRPKLRLKQTGNEVDAKIAYVDWQMLEAMETRTPERLEALTAIACGDDASVGPVMRELLRKEYLLWFNREGEMEPILREVIRSAMRKTPEGSVLVFPFDIKTEVDKDVFVQVQRQDDDIIVRRKPRDDSDYDRSK